MGISIAIAMTSFINQVTVICRRNTGDYFTSVNRGSISMISYNEVNEGIWLAQQSLKVSCHLEQRINLSTRWGHTDKRLVVEW
jgi:hypothetical protein